MSSLKCTAFTVGFAAVVSAVVTAGTADSSKAAAAFVSACRTDSRDPIFGGDAVLAFVHEIGQDSTILYRVANTRVEPLADWHHETAEHSEFLEAQGGVESTAVASDVVAFLRRRPFLLLEHWRSMILRAADIPPCDIKYTETERYRASRFNGTS